MNNIAVTVNLSEEDRARLDKIIEALTHPKAPQAPALQTSELVKTEDNFAYRLAVAMDAAGKRQIDLANETGLDKSTINKYLSGGFEPKHEAMRKLSEALGVSELYLLGYDVPAQRVTPQPDSEPIPEPVAAPEPADDSEPIPEPIPGLEEPAPQHTRAELQHLVVTLTSAGKKAEVRAIVLAVASKVSDIPEDKIDEVFEQLKALEG